MPSRSKQANKGSKTSKPVAASKSDKTKSSQSTEQQAGFTPGEEFLEKRRLRQQKRIQNVVCSGLGLLILIIAIAIQSNSKNTSKPLSQPFESESAFIKRDFSDVLDRNQCSQLVSNWMNHEFEMIGFYALCMTPLFSQTNTNTQETFITLQFDVWSHLYSKSSIIESFKYNLSLTTFTTNSFSSFRNKIETSISLFDMNKSDSINNQYLAWKMYLINNDSRNDIGLNLDSNIIEMNDLQRLQSVAISLHEAAKNAQTRLKSISYKDRANSIGKEEYLVCNKLILLFEGGTFIWPGVRINYTRAIESKDNSYLLQTISLRPLIFEIEDFFNRDEQKQLKSTILTKIGKKFGPSDVENTESYSHWRTSQTAWIEWSESRINNLISLRISDIVKISIYNQETTQVLKYETNEKYGMHFDYFSGNENEFELFRNENRILTALWYINDCCTNGGGQTIFPMFNQTEIDKIYNLKSVEQCLEMRDVNNSLLIEPIAGKIILFYNLLANGKTDRYSLHGACPVGQNNVKFAANKWIWNTKQHNINILDFGKD